MANEINGTDLYVFSNGVVIAHATNHTLGPKMATRKTTNKDSGIFETNASGRLSVTASCDGLICYGDIDILRTAILLRTPLALDFGEQVAGSLDATKIYAMGNFLLTGLDEGAPDGNNATYKATFEHSSGFAYVTSGSLTCRIAHTNVLVHSGTTGAAFAIAHGGTVPYTYAWTGTGIVSPVNVQWITAQPAGTYTVVVTDATGGTALTATATVVISQP